MSWALWNCCLLEKSRNTKRKDGSKEGEVATGVRMDLMIPAHRHLTGGFFFFFFSCLSFIHNNNTHPRSQTHTHKLLNGTETVFFFFFFFTRWSLWAILSPVALHISRAPSFIASSTAAVHYTAQSGWEILWGVDLAESILSSVSGLTLLTPPKKISQLTCFSFCPFSSIRFSYRGRQNAGDLALCDPHMLAFYKLLLRDRARHVLQPRAWKKRPLKM